MMVNALALYSLFILGAVAVVSDVRHRRISNRLILAGMSLAAAGYIFLAFNTVVGSRQMILWGLGRSYLPASFFGLAAVHSAAVLASGIAFWRMGLWPAGDAKLFIVLATLLPLADQNLRGFPNYLFLIILVNIFVAGGLYLTGIVIQEWVQEAFRFWSGDVREKIRSFISTLRRRLRDEWPRRYRYAMLAWNTFALFLIFRAVQQSWNAPQSSMAAHLLIYAALYLAWPRICGLFVRGDVTSLLFLAVTAVVIPLEMVRRWRLVSALLLSGKSAAGFWFILNFFGGIVESYLKQARLVTASVAALEPGTVLTPESWNRVRDSASEELHRYSDGLSREEIAVLQDAPTAGRSQVQFYRARPFAVWVFAGCLWTLFVRENIAECCAQILKSL